MSHHPVVAEWHRIVREADFDALQKLLAEDCVFHSPVVHTPQRGRAITSLYLVAAASVLGGKDGDNSAPPFRYLHEVASESEVALEFQTSLDGIDVNGVDWFRWNAAGEIVEFKVWIRPLKAIQKVHALMAQGLEKLSAQPA